MQELNETNLKISEPTWAALMAMWQKEIYLFVHCIEFLLLLFRTTQAFNWNGYTDII